MQIYFINQMVLIQHYSIELMHKNIEKRKLIQLKKRFHIFVRVRLRKRS